MAQTLGTRYITQTNIKQPIKNLRTLRCIRTQGPFGRQNTRLSSHDCTAALWLWLSARKAKGSFARIPLTWAQKTHQDQADSTLLGRKIYRRRPPKCRWFTTHCRLYSMWWWSGWLPLRTFTPHKKRKKNTLIRISTINQAITNARKIPVSYKRSFYGVRGCNK